MAARYRLDRELGRGGMATVYLAQDLRHERPVALKVLHPELAGALGPERFQREIRLCARLQHPHILTVLDSGETAGQLWFTMPYVEGESLRGRLTRERQLPVEDALRIAREAAQGLQYAHQRGVVHRDIKPENILLTEDGTTLVADFGIAQALGVGKDEGGERLTETGMAVGTPAYMSPEQAAGERAVDARTDVYSLAAVVYEMLAGEPPHTGPTAQAILAKRLSGEVPSVRRVRPAIPVAVDEALQRALCPVPADRFATTAEFARALAAPAGDASSAGSATAGPSGSHPRRVTPALATLALGFLVGLGVLFAWRRSQDDGGGADAGRRTVAVLPFDNLGDSADAYFAEGMTDEVRGKLAALPGLAVIASRSSAEYKGSAKSLSQIGEELGADYLVVGKVRWEKGAGGASRARVSPELVAVASGRSPITQWQQPFDAALTDVFQVQADIAHRVAGALDVALGTEQRAALAARPTADLTAYDAYLKGEALWQLGSAVPAEQRRAIEFYERAVALDSAFAPAWAQLARASALHYQQSVPTSAGAARARVAAERAAALAPGRPETQLALGDYHYLVRNDAPRALAAYEAGLRAAPDHTDLLSATALVEQTLGRWEAALTHFTRAEALDPRSVQTARRRAFTLLWLRRYPEAGTAAERALALAPANLLVIQDRAMVSLAQGDLAQARALLRAVPPVVEPAELVAFMGNYWDLHWVLDEAQHQLLLGLGPDAFGGDRGAWGLVHAQAYAHRGDAPRARIYADSARLAFEEQLRDTPEDAQRRVVLGLALAYLGRAAEAVREGDGAVARLPITRDAYVGAYLQHQLARIYLLVGKPEEALDRLEPLLEMPYYLSPGWLRIDPTFDPLRSNPRFQRLVGGG